MGTGCAFGRVVRRISVEPGPGRDLSGGGRQPAMWLREGRGTGMNRLKTTTTDGEEGGNSCGGGDTQRVPQSRGKRIYPPEELASPD